MTKTKKSVVSSRRERLVRVSAEDIFNRPLTEEQKAQLDRLAVLPDSEIDCSDIPELTEEELARMVRAVPLRDARPKVAVSVRLEPRVIEWLKRGGKGHVSRINDILVQAMLSDRR